MKKFQFKLTFLNGETDIVTLEGFSENSAAAKFTDNSEYILCAEQKFVGFYKSTIRKWELAK